MRIWQLCWELYESDQLAKTIHNSIKNYPETLSQWISFLMTKKPDYRLEFLQAFCALRSDGNVLLGKMIPFFRLFIEGLKSQQTDDTRPMGLSSHLLKNILESYSAPPASDTSMMPV